MEIFGISITKSSEQSRSVIQELKETKEQLRDLTKKFNSLPYKFDYLVEIYTPDQANALVYKLINFHRNQNPPSIELLKRWQKRIDDALTSIK